MGRRLHAVMRSVAGAVSGAAGAVGVYRRLLSSPPAGDERWSRQNHRGEPITLLEGPALAAGGAGGAVVGGSSPRLKAAGVVAAMGAGAFGLIDDLAESRVEKGLKGHLGALRRGEVTTGALKIAGIGVTGMLAAALATPRRTSSLVGHLADLTIAGAVIASSANLINLFDLRPGRAIKASALVSVPLAVSGAPGSELAGAALGAAASLASVDLGESAMAGDCGANALGALIGTSAVSVLGRRGRLAVLGMNVGLTVASEKVSFTRVIESNAILSRIDAWGRRS